MSKRNDDRDRKSFTGGASVGSTSKSGKSGGTTASKLRNMALEKAEKQKKEREAHPERRLFFRPKVYDFWKDDDIDDEIAEREALIAQITAKEAEIKKMKEDGEIDSDDEEEEDELANQKAALEHLKHRKEREAAYRARLEAEQIREEQEKAAADEEKAISEMQNPSIYGWFHTDGYYENAPYFGVKQEIIDKINEDQEVWKEKWLVKHPESFTDKFKRYFWPPKLRFRKKMFRTRGKYMDFPEVIADWPKAIDVNFEKDEREIVTNRHTIFEENIVLKEVEEELKELEEELDPDKVFGLSEIDEQMRRMQFHMGKAGKLNWDDWYYDDELGEFFRKSDALMIEFYMDNVNMCWRKKRQNRKNPDREPTPYDWYFDFDTATFLARADFKELHSHEFFYDQKHGVYKVQPIIPTGKPKGLQNSKGSNKSKKNKKSILNKSKNTSNGKVSDYYFDEEVGKWLLKSEVPDEKKDQNQFFWDENGHRFAHKVIGSDWRGLTGFSPDDYYFDDKFGRFTVKPARQGKEFKYYSKDGVWRKENAPPPDKITSITNKTPNDYYFDEFEGQYKDKELGAGHQYWRQKYSLIWRKHDEPKSGMYPENFYWDRDKKLWLPRSIRMEMIKNARLAKSEWASEITRGTKDQNNVQRQRQPDSFFWDIEEGRFALKTKHMECYLDTDGFWKSKELRDKQRHRIFPYDFYYNHIEKAFVLKQKDGSYIFNESAHVWTLPDAPEQLEIHYYFDVELERWLTTTGTQDKDNSDDNNGVVNVGFFVKPHTNNQIKIPDDFWFDENQGRFFHKDLKQIADYYYNSTEGVWKTTGNDGPNVKGLHPRNFFFDEQYNRFNLQVSKHKQDYWYDNNNKIFRHIVSEAGATRTGFQPTDFAWSSDLRAYVLDKNKRGKFVDEKLNWDPMRRYSKGWL